GGVLQRKAPLDNWQRVESPPAAAYRVRGLHTGEDARRSAGPGFASSCPQPQIRIDVFVASTSETRAESAEPESGPPFHRSWHYVSRCSASDAIAALSMLRKDAPGEASHCSLDERASASETWPTVLG